MPDIIETRLVMFTFRASFMFKFEDLLTLKPLLQFDTKYYYEVGIGSTTRQFWFVTPPEVGPDAAYTFGLIGTSFTRHVSTKVWL